MAAAETETALSVKFASITWIPATRVVPVATMDGVAAVLEQDKSSAMIEQAQPLPIFVPSTTLQDDAAVFVRGALSELEQCHAKLQSTWMPFTRLYRMVRSSSDRAFPSVQAISCQHSPDMDAVHQTLQDDAIIFGSVYSSETDQIHVSSHSTLLPFLCRASFHSVCFRPRAGDPFTRCYSLLGAGHFFT